VSRLPIVDCKKMEKVLLGRTTTLPHHPGNDLARPLIREILREIDCTPERFRQELDNL